MPYKTLNEVPDSIKIHRSAILTLEQANYWAKMYDGVKDNPDVEVPGALAWKQFELKYQLSGNEWVERTSKSEKGSVSIKVALMKEISEEEQIVYGIAMRPNELDTDKEWLKPETVEKTAIDFMKSYGGFNLDHKKDNEGYVSSRVIESTIVRAPFEFGGEKVLKGDWFIGIHIPDKGDWQEVKKRGGLSIEGTGKRGKAEKSGDKITLTLKIKGE